MSEDTSEEKPFHLQGNFAPVKEEITATDLKVIGAIPPELQGIYARNSANPVSGHSDHWFLGNGMVHGVCLEGGEAKWYRNRYVDTPFYRDPTIERISNTGQIDYTAAAANTHVIQHARKIMALEEGSFPFILDRELNTLGHHDFDGRLEGPMTAHPKICPITGELLMFSYGQLPPYFVYHRVSPDGKLVQSEEIAVNGPTMHHDFAITEKYAIVMDLPVIFDLQLALQGTMPFHWSDDYPARMGLIPRTGTNDQVKWFDVDPCYVFHGLNAYDDGDDVVFDACRISEIWRDAGSMDSGNGESTLHRFTFNTKTGTTSEQTLDERGMDFPRVADASVGQKHRYGYTVMLGQGEGGQPGFGGLLKTNFADGTSKLNDFGENRNPSEPSFVPAAGADPQSDEGYVMSYVHDEASNKTEFVILDATNFDGEPIARVKLPQRVPYGFHGSWMPDPS
jgi:carotenoid cleavage dioxygenase-like enzyme